MKALLLLSALLGFTPAPLGGMHQSLSFVLNSSNASTQRLAHYRASTPIAVHVAGDARQFDAVTVLASGPDGLAVRTPLARTPNGFDGAVRLPEPGAWTVGIITQLGSVSNAIGNVSLDVQAVDASDLAGYLALVFAAACTCAGITIIVRRASARRDYET